MSVTREKITSSFNNRPTEKKRGVCVGCGKSNKLFIHQKCGDLYKKRTPGLKPEKDHPLTRPRSPTF